MWAPMVALAAIGVAYEALCGGGRALLAGVAKSIDYKTLLLLLSPVSPHICEEIWEKQGYGAPVYTQAWPEYDENSLVKDEVEIAVQVNGKVKGKLMIPATLTRESAQEELPKLPQVQKIVDGRQIVKVIFVPGRLLNIVVK